MAEPTNNEKPTIIIIKRKKAGGHGHHGGAWKVAYADFVTAMMAFFLLLWLLNATTQEQKLGISNYFEPIRVTASAGATGSNGVLGGKTIQSQDQMETDKSSPVMQQPTGSTEDGAKKKLDDKLLNPTKTPEQIKLEDAKKVVKNAETQEFNKIKEKIEKEISGIPTLKDLAKNLIIDQTDEGLRIQITDRDKYSMFPVGSSMMYTYTRKLVELVSDAIKNLPNRLSISGHTDAAPFPANRGYTNWELSSDRANACRRVLIGAGIEEARIRDVVGRADKDLLNPTAPLDASNRRISIILLKSNL